MAGLSEVLISKCRLKGRKWIQNGLVVPPYIQSESVS